MHKHLDRSLSTSTLCLLYFGRVVDKELRARLVQSFLALIFPSTIPDKNYCKKEKSLFLPTYLSPPSPNSMLITSLCFEDLPRMFLPSSNRLLFGKLCCTFSQFRENTILQNHFVRDCSLQNFLELQATYGIK